VDYDHAQRWGHSNVSCVFFLLQAYSDVKWRSPYHFESHGSKTNWNKTNIFQWSTGVSSHVPLKNITLPPLSNRLHLFALSITPSRVEQTNGPALTVRRVRFSSRWENVDGMRAQAVQVTLANLAPASAFSSGSVLTPFKVYIMGSNMITISPGIVNRLVASDQVRVDVLVLSTSSSTSRNATVQINDSFGNIVGISDGWPITPLRRTWIPDPEDLSAHETPTWVATSTFTLLSLVLMSQASGIRQSTVYCKWTVSSLGLYSAAIYRSIHWGPYSVPAWV
jgi:hypothetical protein